MKFHRLTIRNLTTITGEQVVDFDALFNEGSPLLIHGPTGAGKTTILDGITLALYDETARISDEAQGKKNQLELNGLKVNDPRQIVSRGASEASAELIFSTVVRGTRRYFRAGWQVERAVVRKGNPEKWGETRRLLVELNSDLSDKRDGLRVVSTKFKEYNPVFEEALGGLKSAQFRRSVLLAQGQFAALLTADASERADMLEGLTGTKEFSQIGLRAHEAYAAAKQAVEKINLEIKGASLWSDEAKAENLRQQELQTFEAARLGAEELVAKAGVAWWQERLQREQAQTRAVEAADAARAGHAALQPLRDWSVRYQATAPLISHHEAWEKGDRDANARRADAAQLEPKIARLREQQLTSEASHAAASEEVAKANAENAAVVDALPEVQALHGAAAAAAQKLETAKSKFTAASAATKAADTKLQQASTAATLQQSKVAAARKASDAFQPWRGREAEVATLERATVAFKVAVAHLPAVMQRQQALELVNQLEQADKALSKEREATAELARKHDEVVLQEQAAAERLGESMQSVVDAEQHRDLLKQLASIEQHRHLLTPGEACALCGATEHPFAATPVSDRVREIETAVTEFERRSALRDTRQSERTALQATLHAAAGALTQRKSQLLQAERQQSEAASRLQARATELNLPVAGLRDALRREQEEATAARAAAEQSLLDAAAWLPLPALQQASLDCDARLRAIQEEINRAATAAAEVVTQEALLASAASAVAQAHDVVAETTAVSTAAEAEVAEATAAFAVAKQRVAERWSGRAPDEVVKASTAAVAAVELRLKEEAERLSTLKVALARETTLHRQLLEAADEAAAQAQTARTLRDNGLREAGCHLDRFLADLRSPAELSAATERLATAEEKLRACIEACNAAAAAIGAHLQTPVPGAFEAALDATNEVERLGGLIKLTIGELSRLRGALEEAERHAALQAGRKLALAAAEELQGRWKVIYDLIGGNKGDAFRKAAQALNLERVIRAANIWLRELDDRYTFRQSFHGDGSPSLDFHLIDAYHADTPRGINLISGGESFLCSLALALGLASERGDTLSIETLLLDEGFGTLDSGSLEVAIQTLEKLKHRQTAVGIISHVEGLRSRIETQLEVRPVAPGRSVITQSRCP